MFNIYIHTYTSERHEGMKDIAHVQLYRDIFAMQLEIVRKLTMFERRQSLSASSFGTSSLN